MTPIYTLSEGCIGGTDWLTNMSVWHDIVTQQRRYCTSCCGCGLSTLLVPTAPT